MSSDNEYDFARVLAELGFDAAWIRDTCLEVCARTPPSVSGESLVQKLRRLPLARRGQILAATAGEAAADCASDPEVREWLEFDDPIDDD